MADWLEERFIEATPRRTRQACEEGRVPRSRELMATMVLTTCFGMVIWRGPQTFVKLQDTLRQRLSAPPWSRLHSEEVVAEFIGLLGQVFLVVFPFLLGLVSCAIALGILQSGWLWLPNRVLPDPGRVNPLRGAAKLFSAVRLAESLAGTAKMLLIAAVCVWSYWRHRVALLSVSFYDVSDGCARMFGAILRCCGDLLVALTMFAALDYACRWWHHRQSLRMSDMEMREEIKSREGDPAVRRQRQQHHRKLAAGRGRFADQSDPEPVNRHSST